MNNPKCQMITIIYSKLFNACSTHFDWRLVHFKSDTGDILINQTWKEQGPVQSLLSLFACCQVDSSAHVIGK